MVEYRFDSGDSISDHVPDDAEIESVRYSDGEEIVKTIESEEDRPSEYELYEMEREELYGLGKELGVGLNWNGEEAHTSDEMAQKIKKEAYEEN